MWKSLSRIHSCNADGRYIVRLPFKVDDDPSRSLGDLYTTAFRSLLRMETRFFKDEKLKVAYLELMPEYEVMTHMIISAQAPASFYHITACGKNQARPRSYAPFLKALRVQVQVAC